MTNQRRFEDKVVFVTGGARGQGRSHAVGFAREGAQVVVVDVLADVPEAPYPMGTPNDLNRTVELVEAEGAKVLALKADVRSRGDLDRAVSEALAAFGQIDVLVANAGIASIGTIGEMPDEVWQAMIDINLSGVFKSMRAVIPHMVERRSGRIVATSSIVGRQGSPNIGHYVAAKWGVIGLVKSAALELADKGITVNAVAPTSVNTTMIQNRPFEELFLPDVDQPTREEVERAYTALNPIPIPWLEPEDVTAAVLFLASEEARYITGEALPIAAGWNARNAS